MSSARFEDNFPSWLTIPMNRLNSGTLVGAAIFSIAMVFSGSTLITSSSMRCPRNLSLVFWNSHFAGFSVAPADWMRRSTWLSRSVCSFSSRPKTSTSSI